MLIRLRALLSSIFWMVFALVLGYAFADVCFRWFVPELLMAPCALFSGMAFFFVLRWLKKDDGSQEGRPTTAASPVARSVTIPQGLIIRETVSSSSQMLQARALAELSELLTQSRLHRKEQREQLDRIVARATAKSKGCTSAPKKS